MIGFRLSIYATLTQFLSRRHYSSAISLERLTHLSKFFKVIRWLITTGILSWQMSLTNAKKGRKSSRFSPGKKYSSPEPPDFSAAFCWRNSSGAARTSTQYTSSSGLKEGRTWKPGWRTCSVQRWERPPDFGLLSTGNDRRDSRSSSSEI